MKRAIYTFLTVPLVAVGAAAACGPKAPEPVAVPPAGDAGQPVVAASAPASASASAAPPVATGSDAGAFAGPKLCGCGLCEPLLGDDPCTSDSDCAGNLACHADRCVAVAKAEPKQPGHMCTRIMKCATTDANACGCFQGRCALIPRKS